MSNNLLILGRALITEARRPARHPRTTQHSADELAAFARIGARTPAFPHPRQALPVFTPLAAE